MSADFGSADFARQLISANLLAHAVSSVGELLGSAQFWGWSVCVLNRELLFQALPCVMYHNILGLCSFHLIRFVKCCVVG